MNFEQAAIVGLLVCMFIIYALEKFRVEVVAISGLAVAIHDSRIVQMEVTEKRRF